MVLAAQALQKEMEAFTLQVDGQSRRGPLHRSLTSAALDRKLLSLGNESGADMRVILNVSGIPLRPEPPIEKGYGIERRYFTLKGQEIRPDQFRQNERYIVKLSLKDNLKRQARLLVVDPLPAGLEIENAAIGGAANTEGFAFLGDLLSAEHTEARDDRFVAALEYTPSDKGPALTLAYLVRAVTPGTYTHPAAIIEDMYAPENFGRAGFEAIGKRRRLVTALLALPLLGWGALELAIRQLPKLDMTRAAERSTVVLDREGQLLRPFVMADGRWRMPVSLDEVDPRYLEMLVAYEDRRFHAHAGVDPLALARAAWQLARRGRVVSGGSTLTMQVARLLEPREERSLRAADVALTFRQALRAIELERRFSQREILELYLALAPFGGNVEGVRAAALGYFGREPKRLSTAEAALLVALPQAPESRRPDRFPEAATAARERVLNRIREGRSLLTPPASWHSPRRRVRHWPCGARLREHRKRCVRCVVPAGR